MNCSIIFSDTEHTFESDRSGSQKIYVMNLKTKKLKELALAR